MDSFKKRYFYKLFSNAAILTINVFAAGIVPRGLGPKSYGDYSFLTNIYTQAVSFLDMGTSSCLYMKVSQKQNEPRIMTFYAYFAAVVAFLVFAQTLVLQFTPYGAKLWPGQRISFVYLAAGLAIIAWIGNLIGSMTDAYGVTVPAEKVKVIQKIVGVALLALLYLNGRLNLFSFFAYQYFILLFLLVSLIIIIERNGFRVLRVPHLSREEAKAYLREFYVYSHPLFLSSLIGLLAGILDRWLLQVFGGSIQQGFYGFSLQIGSFCFLFVGAMTPLLMREFSVASAQKDKEHMVQLIRRYFPLLFSIVAYFCCFVAIESKEVAYLFGGERFRSASAVLMIMAFYPIHQTYGQLTGSLFLATGETRVYRNIGVIGTLLGLPVTYLLIAPRDAFGVDAGAVGLALKMVLIQFFGVNVQLYFNSRMIGFPFAKYLLHQCAVISSFTMLALAASFIVRNVIGLRGIAHFAVSGFTYTLILAAVVYVFPALIGLKDNELSKLLKMSREKIGAVIPGVS